MKGRRVNETVRVSESVADLPSWMAENETPCAEGDSDLWFSEEKSEQRKAVAICNTCPFQRECNEFGSTMSFGIWGGKRRSSRAADRVLADERRQLREKRTVEIVKLYADGMGVTEIARRLGMAHSSVATLLKDAG